VFEPWIVSLTSGAGFTVYVDNGSGGASAGLLSAVSAWITGSIPAKRSGYRPAGVPFTVSGVTPVYASVAVTGTLIPGFQSTDAAASTALASIQNYFSTLGFAVPAEQPQVAAAAANAALGLLSSLTVNLYYASSPGSPVASVTGSYNNRVILSAITIDFVAGT
jgi:hypothetical protein